MKVLTRYILRSHIGPFFFAFVALTGVILVNTLAKEMAGLAGKGLSGRVLFEFFILSLPSNIALTLPMAVLVAVLYTFAQMAAENEITALKASGVDLRRAVLPLMICAAVIAAGMIWFNDRVLTESNYRWRMLMTDVAQASPLLLLREETINPIRSAGGGTRYYLRAAEIDYSTSRLQDVMIVDMSTSSVSRTIYADSGRMAMNADKTDLLLTLFDGHIREIDLAEPESFQQMSFERQILRMQDIGQRLERTGSSTYRSDRDMTVAMMNAQIDTLQAELAEITAPGALPAAPGGIDSIGLASRESRIEDVQYQIREYGVEIQKKFAIAIATLVFVLIGVPLALRFPRGGVGMVIAVSLTIFAIYYVGLIGGESLADEGHLPPVLSMWITNILLGGLGLAAMLRIGHEHSSGRGGGWGDLPTWLRRK